MINQKFLLSYLFDATADKSYRASFVPCSLFMEFVTFWRDVIWRLACSYDGVWFLCDILNISRIDQYSIQKWFVTSIYLICHYLFKGVEKFEAKERWKLPKGDVLFSPSLLDFHETENAKYWSGNSRKPEWTQTRFIKIPKWNKRLAWFSDIKICHILSKKLILKRF